MNVALRCPVRCANLACAHEWTAVPDRSTGMTTIGDCPKCKHTMCVVLAMHMDGEPKAAQFPVSSETVAEDPIAANNKAARRARAEALIEELNENRHNDVTYDKVNRVVRCFEVEMGLGMLINVRKAIPYRPDVPNKFLEELESHRGLINAIAEQDVCNPEVRALARAVWFLLAVAHQP